MKLLREEDPAGMLFRESIYIKRKDYTYDGLKNTWYEDSNKNSNHMGLLYMVAKMDSRERFYALK